MAVTKDQVEKTAKAAQKKAMDAGQAVGEAAKTAATKAKEGLVAFGSTVANKSKELMETAKLNTQKTQKQKELEEAYRTLGEMAYAKGRLRGEMGETAKKIKGIYAELQQLEVALNAAQSTRECKNCGVKHYVGDNYCPNCGAKQ
ncbi:zinc ribbon domain-containing protein [Christensenella intestinihominis]|uniref:zinc ribbon domain-containing protein n=1 Tax=Christensenella intestinihominis TaxID=1851429 RepID=UPI00082CDBED|nr:zinc ribbon domain-containing protein [Christensenella intestinihominis]